jgi:formate hydrogenlyase subunit 3/multisubunit Na+/H+ antiporter MnhD subunit
MAHQAFLNDRAGRSNGLIDNVSSFSNDLATLATLQTKLAAADLREGLQKAAPAVGVLAAVGLLSVAGVTALVIGLAFWLAESFQLRTGSALALVGLGSLVVAALGAWLGARALASSFATFRRSSEELERNLAWIKTTLTQSGR